MGCESSKNNFNNNSEDSEIYENLKNAIACDSVSKLEEWCIALKFSKKIVKEYINKPSLQGNSNQLELPLAYALDLGKAKAFKFLLSKGGEFLQVEEFFRGKKISILELIFKKNHVDLFKEFLPIYLSYPKPENFLRESFPNHVATRYGLCKIILYTQEYFNNNPPEEFSLDLVNNDGDNCFFVACRYGNYGMLQWFDSNNLKVNMRFKNSQGQNALMITLKGYLTNGKSFDYHKCVEYLIMKKYVDVCENYQEVLELASFRDTVELIEKELEKNDIFEKKKIVMSSVLDDNSKNRGTEEYKSNYNSFIKIDGS